MNYIKPKQHKPSRQFDKVQVLRVVLVMIGVLLIGRLFYVQIIKHDYYQAQALAEHIKKFEISAPRGIIRFQDGDSSVPVVLNETKYTVFADPKYITNSEETAAKLIGTIGGDKDELAKKLKNSDSRYVILAKKLTKDQANRVDALDLKGVGLKEVSVRTYPQTSLAAQLLGFVNDEGIGQYGLEGYLDEELGGTPGLEKAITDVRGVPLALSNDNVLKKAEPGKDITLTIDLGMQRMVEETLKAGVERTKSLKGTAVIIDVNTGAIKAMANYPTYDPNQFDKVQDASVFVNTAVTGSYEPGSVMKPLLVGAAINEGAVTPKTSYFDPGFVNVDGYTITNSTPWGARTTTVEDVLHNSLNTGAVQVLKFMGGGELNQKGRVTWNNYMTNHYQFGKQTGVEQDNEASGGVSSPTEGDGLNIRYANMAFGQGVTVTPLQLAAAYVSLVNGGTYYKPTLLASSLNSDGTSTQNAAKKVQENVVSSETSAQVRKILEDTLIINNKLAIRPGYSLGAKSGTAQIADSNGNYRTDAFDGTYAGYIGGDSPQYVMVVRLDEPKTGGFASFQASIVWAEISNKLIDNFAIKPKSS